MAPILYMIHPGPPSRAVIMTAKAIGLNLQLKEVNHINEEHLKPPYTDMNPQHTIPTLVDDGLTICDSHAIMTYLVSKYAKNDSLYPKDLEKRALVDQRLFFEAGTVFPILRRISRPILLHGQTFIEEANKKAVIESYSFLNAFLEGNKWVAGDFLSIADFSLLSSIGTIRRLIPVNEEKYSNVVEWLKRCEKLPEYVVNQRGEMEMVDLLMITLQD